MVQSFIEQFYECCRKQWVGLHAYWGESKQSFDTTQLPTSPAYYFNFDALWHVQPTSLQIYFLMKICSHTVSRDDRHWSHTLQKERSGMKFKSTLPREWISSQVKSRYISQNNPLGFSNRERLAEPLINFYIINCQVTKTIDDAQVLPREMWERD